MIQDPSTSLRSQGKKPFQNQTKIVDFEPQKLYYVISKPALLGKITYV